MARIIEVCPVTSIARIDGIGLGNPGGIQVCGSRIRIYVISCAAALLLLPVIADAYVGPGAGFALLGSFSAVFIAFFAGAFALLLWPFRYLIRLFRRRKALKKAWINRIVVIGLDGLDPGLAEQWIDEGYLPNLGRLAKNGGFERLRTTYPSISPVAWSSFMTGVDPSRHNIYDFLDRDLKTYMPKLSSSEISPTTRTIRVGNWIIPLGKPLIRAMRKSRAFWSILGEHGISCNVLRVPLTFPPEKFAGAMLSAMCVPDLRGTQGSFSYFTTSPDEVGVTEAAPESTGGLRILVRQEDGVINASLPGPANTMSANEDSMEIPFTVNVDTDKGRGILKIAGRRYTLNEREYSPWIKLVYKPMPGVKVHGIARFYITKMSPNFGLYVTPINIDPGDPALPISWPAFYSVYLSKLIGEFATLGLAEDTWALNERVIDEGAFLQQAVDHHEEREKMFFNALEKSREGVVACVFDGTDRVQHMFYRYLDKDHPANRGKDVEVYKNTIRDMYIRCDEMVGRAIEYLGEDDCLMVVSDHGFSSFRRGVNLNTWLVQNGYMFLKEGADGTGQWLADIDWSRTKAYAMGLSGLYINRKGREAHGIVAPGEEAERLKREIIAGLSGLRDEEADTIAINEVFNATDVHSAGPYQEGGLDLIVGYNRGYRASWQGAVGQVMGSVFWDNTKSWSGDHSVDPRLVPGVIFSTHPVISEDPGIMDLAPTILTMFGVDVPAHMTGRVLDVAQEAAT
ncbi:MAG: nucleotide pyrophosphatase [Chromatiales bacterium]|nr:nucleotide pyrophosphatase [Chromatiales bacterium]